MSRFQFHTVLAGATALALVAAAPVQAQQSGDTTQQAAATQGGQGAEMQPVRERISDRLASASGAIEAGSLSEARDAVQEASDALTEAMDALSEPNDRMQRLSGSLEEARAALDSETPEPARAALSSAQVDLGAIEDSAWPDGQQSTAQADVSQQAAAEVKQTAEAAEGRQPVPQGAESASETSGTGDQQAAGATGQTDAEAQQQASAEGEAQAGAAGQQASARAGAESQQQAGAETQQTGAETQQQAGAEPQQTGTGSQQQAGMDTGAEAQQQAGAETQQTGTEGQQQAGAEGQAAAGGEQAGGTNVIEAEVVDTDTSTVAAGEEAAPATGQEAQTAEGGSGFEAEVVKGDQLSVEKTNQMLGMSDTPAGEPAEVLTLSPADLEDRDVVTLEGDEIGEIDSIVMSDGQVNAIIAHGGFLGIGKNRVAIPLSRLGMRGDDVVLLGLTEEQLDAMPEFDFETSQALPEDESLQIGRYD